MRIHSRYFDDEIKKLYNVDPIIADDGYVLDGAALSYMGNMWSIVLVR